MDKRPSYLRIFLLFARNCLIRDMTFRMNFLIESVSSLSWVMMNLGFYVIIFQYTPMIGAGTGWGQYEFFVFISTTMFINSLVQTFFMSNVQEFSELIRTGELDFALLMPIDTQFLISTRRVNWSSLANFLFAAALLAYSLWQLEIQSGFVPSTVQIVLYPLYVLLGVAIFYSLMISLAATSIWLGRNLTLYNFWFYITNFSRYPMEIYKGDRFGTPFRQTFTYIIPVLVVVNVPARMMAMPLSEQNWPLAGFAVFAAAVSLLASRWIFLRALLSYRSASS